MVSAAVDPTRRLEMTQLLEKKDTTLAVEPPVGVKKRIGRIVAVAALIAVVGGWLAFGVASIGAETERLEATVARSQAMDLFYQGQLEAERLERLIARSQAMDEIYKAPTDGERLERLITRSVAMNEFYRADE
jgi:hypothetical protein